MTCSAEAHAAISQFLCVVHPLLCSHFSNHFLACKTQHLSPTAAKRPRPNFHTFIHAICFHASELTKQATPQRRRTSPRPPLQAAVRARKSATNDNVLVALGETIMRDPRAHVGVCARASMCVLSREIGSPSPSLFHLHVDVRPVEARKSHECSQSGLRWCHVCVCLGVGMHRVK